MVLWMFTITMAIIIPLVPVWEFSFTRTYHMTCFNCALSVFFKLFVLHCQSYRDESHFFWSISQSWKKLINKTVQPFWVFESFSKLQVSKGYLIKLTFLKITCICMLSSLMYLCITVMKCLGSKLMTLSPDNSVFCELNHRKWKGTNTIQFEKKTTKILCFQIRSLWSKLT